MLDIKMNLTTQKKQKPADDQLTFGKMFTDHMFVMNYSPEQGWHDARIVPYGDISLSPAAVVLHYAQEVFEGLKAYRSPVDGKIRLFRPEKNARRMIDSAERLCIPPVPEDIFLEAVEALVKVDRDWVPHKEGTSLYIRPFVFGDEGAVGATPSSTYQFIVIVGPVGAYYATGINPVKINVEETYVRAAPGLTGYTKCGGNYAASFIGQEKAHKLGFAQTLWLDGVHRKYVEEVGSMNIMFKMDGVIYTAPAEGTVLPGITRMSCIELLRKWGYEVREEHVDIETIMQAGRDGKLEEVFGTGTAAVISPVGELRYRDEDVVINNGEIGPLTHRLYDTLTGIQWGRLPDEMGWTRVVE